MKFLIIILLSSLSIVAQASCSSRLDDGLAKRKMGFIANKNASQLHKKIIPYFEEYIYIPQEACVIGIEMLKHFWSSSNYFYESYLIGQDIDLDVCSYNSLSDDSYFAKDVKFDSKKKYEKMFSAYLIMRKRIANDCTMYMNVPDMKDPSNYFQH